VQGKIRGEFISVTIESNCAHCNRKVKITADSNLQYKIHNGNSELRAFLPYLDWSKFVNIAITDFY
jgi:hypothetical protein